MTIVYPQPPDPGWHPINHMVRLAAELFDAELLVVSINPASRLRQLGALSGRGRGNSPCLLICPTPTQLSSLLAVPGWKKRFSTVAVWVIDSFWPERVPRTFRWTKPFDQVYVTTEEDVDVWTEMLGAPTEYLPWGSDVLRLGSTNANRSIDLIRVGRQPAGWSDDAASASACEQSGIRFHGGPTIHPNPLANQRELMAKLSLSRFMLAFSNIACPASYGHPTREYLTGRWVDALASGTTVAGVHPSSHSIERLLWPGATLNLGTTECKAVLPTLREAVKAWQPEMANRNNRMALQRLDWRWRFSAIAQRLGQSPPLLHQELEMLQCATRPPSRLPFN